jgi:5-methylcytosine-specific restriction enzyme A
MKQDWHHLYKTAEWKRLRRARLTACPTCVYCEQQGRVTAATVVDHIVPHKGDIALFFDYSNTQSMCDAHHNSTKQREENNGLKKIGCDINGEPLDMDSHWYK